ncbi:carboxymuconolactone decarboxylase family protein [Variovorax sp. J22P240]|uniref:carboxymuconolactone decarboxylase family protein n=1 Tax=Variovorax sp. J22P240 TaxID=3053514 RepID=UPI002574E062|nr:carboxymuconolactone decarboxylase family protein [Variovorax sp. J22P240]MDL9997330.1 carboxymuconolactone decarboxylase family protein [Variovorax sp. J22P240]
MAVLLSEIQWGDPVLPAAHDVEWEAELKRRGAQVLEVDRRVAPSRWLREAAYEATSYVPGALTERLHRMGNMVTAQENSCRYCYGANRAYMKVLGYSESFIQQVERDVQTAELDDKERAYIAFCRSLARSRPRPAAAERAALLKLGYTPAQIGEIAFAISLGCFYNRVSTLLACPSEQKFERMASGPFRWLLALAMPLMKKFAPSRPAEAAMDQTALAAGPFGVVVAPLAGLHAGRVMKAALDGAFETGVLSRSAKVLMFAVVARTLGCPHCEAAATQLLFEEGLSQTEIESALATLRCPRLAQREAGLLAWARDTVYYEPSSIQQKTRALGTVLDADALLEAIGVASLANGTVRLAMLLE